jgi:hypothetical protein
MIGIIRERLGEGETERAIYAGTFITGNNISLGWIFLPIILFSRKFGRTYFTFDKSVHDRVEKFSNAIGTGQIFFKIRSQPGSKC